MLAHTPVIRFLPNQTYIEGVYFIDTLVDRVFRVLGMLLQTFLLRAHVDAREHFLLLGVLRLKIFVLEQAIILGTRTLPVLVVRETRAHVRGRRVRPKPGTLRFLVLSEFQQALALLKPARLSAAQRRLLSQVVRGDARLLLLVVVLRVARRALESLEGRITVRVLVIFDRIVIDKQVRRIFPGEPDLLVFLDIHDLIEHLLLTPVQLIPLYSELLLVHFILRLETQMLRLLLLQGLAFFCCWRFQMPEEVGGGLLL